MAITEKEWARTQSLKAALNDKRAEMSDAEASKTPALYPVMLYDGRLIKAGTRINWLGQLKRAATDLWDRKDQDPDNHPNGWEDINYRGGYRIIPETITAGTAFAKDEMGWWGDQLYKSIFEGANVWTPEGNPVAWELVIAS